MDLNGLITTLLVIYFKQVVKTCLSVCSVEYAVIALGILYLQHSTQASLRASGDEKDMKIRELEKALQRACSQQTYQRTSREDPADSCIDGQQVHQIIRQDEVDVELLEPSSNGLPPWVHDLLLSPKLRFLVSVDDIVYDIKEWNPIDSNPSLCTQSSSQQRDSCMFSVDMVGGTNLTERNPTKLRGGLAEMKISTKECLRRGVIGVQMIFFHDVDVGVGSHVVPTGNTHMYHGEGTSDCSYRGLSALTTSSSSESSGGKKTRRHR